MNRVLSFIIGMSLLAIAFGFGWFVGAQKKPPTVRNSKIVIMDGTSEIMNISIPASTTMYVDATKLLDGSCKYRIAEQVDILEQTTPNVEEIRKERDAALARLRDRDRLWQKYVGRIAIVDKPLDEHGVCGWCGEK